MFERIKSRWREARGEALQEEISHSLGGSDILEEPDALARHLIQAGRSIGAKNAREAMEIALGRPSTDEEWECHRETWERNWNQ